MKIVIAGGRDYNDYNRLKKVMDFLLQNTDKSTVTIISGCAKGADALGERYAHEKNMVLWKFPANWKEHGVKAGPIRNREMAENATHLVAFPGGKGTADMIRTAKKLGLIIREIK